MSQKFLAATPFYSPITFLNNNWIYAYIAASCFCCCLIIWYRSYWLMFKWYNVGNSVGSNNMYRGKAKPVLVSFSELYSKLESISVSISGLSSSSTSHWLQTTWSTNYYCYDLKTLVLANEKNLVYGYTRELDRTLYKIVYLIYYYLMVCVSYF